MSLIEYIANLINTCPYLENDVTIDFNDKNPRSYAIQPEPTQPYIKKYTRGGGVKQYVFDLSAREYTDIDIHNQKNVEMYLNVSTWLDTITDTKQIPAMLDSSQPLKIEALSNGYLMEADSDMKLGRYVMQCKLTYVKRR